MKAIICIMSIFLVGFVDAQVSDEVAHRGRNGWHFETMAVPGLVYNSLTVGAAYVKSPDTEHVINLTGSCIWTGMSLLSTTHVRYNYNITLSQRKKRSGYLPLWAICRYSSYPGNGEEGNEPFQLLNYTIGTGYGTRFVFKNDHKIRLELRVGAGVYNFRKHDQYRHVIDIFYLPSPNYLLPSFALNVRYVIPLSKK